MTATGFKITDATNGWNRADFNDVFISKDCFIEGNLWVWGRNCAGQLGNLSISDASSPVQTVSSGTNWKKVSIGNKVSVAIKTDGTLWLWGLNNFGQLGRGDTIARSSPVQTVSGGTDWKTIASSVYNTAGIKTDGSLWNWGWGGNGGNGTNTTVSVSSPVQTIAGGNNWKSVVSNFGTVAAIKTDGTLWLWGNNNGGKLGINSLITVSSPVQTISGGTDWKQISAGSGHFSAIKTDGSLWSWGCNPNGQLGTEDRDARSSPVQTVSGGTNWIKLGVSSESFTTFAIKTDGTLWAWGSNVCRMVGNVSEAGSRSSPVQTTTGGTNWRCVSMGIHHTIGIKTDGTIWGWGSNTFGQQGINNSVAIVSSPTQILTSETWSDVVASGYSSAGIK
jgi:alpha-tubulin suppressor-like RCC1 family protein